MKTIATLFTAFIVAGWIAVIALVAVQNAEPVSFRFLNVQTIQVPFGVALAFAAALGIVGMAIAQPLLGFSIAQPEEEEDF